MQIRKQEQNIYDFDPSITFIEHALVHTALYRVKRKEGGGRLSRAQTYNITIMSTTFQPIKLGKSFQTNWLKLTMKLKFKA